MKSKLWNRDFTLLMAATALGAAGHIMGSFALSFMVFDETGSTLASALILAIQVVPAVFVPFVISPVMDRLSRKTYSMRRREPDFPRPCRMRLSTLARMAAGWRHVSPLCL